MIKITNIDMEIKRSKIQKALFYSGIFYYKFFPFIFGDLLITTKCPANCSFCIYGKLDKWDMSRENISILSKSFKNIGIRNVRISGGEPFVVYNNLLYAIGELKKYYPLSRISIVTSCLWANDMKETYEKLNILNKQCGIRKIFISFDAFHLEHIPISNYYNCFKVLKDLNMRFHLTIRYSKGLKEYFPDLITIVNEFNPEVSLKLTMPVGNAENWVINKIISFRDIVKIKHLFLGQEQFFNPSFIFGKVKKFIFKYNCFMLTAFPDGDIHFCCLKRENTFMGSIKDESLEEIYRKFKQNNWKNFCRIIKYLIIPQEKNEFICKQCPIKAV
jgi:hypothetical protein